MSLEFFKLIHRIRLSLGGWLRDLPDPRDHRFAAPELAALPDRVDLTPECPPVLEQGDLGSCTANAIANAHLFCQLAQKKADPVAMSRLFIYWNERRAMGLRYIAFDSGAYIRDGFKSIAKKGVCPETTWPYIITRFRVKPRPAAYEEAKNHQGLEYLRVNQDVESLKACLASGFPFVFGFSVFASMMQPAVMESGVIPLPSDNDSLQGGHAVLAVGYDDATGRFRFQNSWGTEVGRGGFFEIPYEYLANEQLAADFWTLRVVE